MIINLRRLLKNVHIEGVKQDNLPAVIYEPVRNKHVTKESEQNRIRD